MSLITVLLTIKGIKMKRTIAVILMCAMSQVFAATKKTVAPTGLFYVYTDKNDSRNHFIPSGWMGDYGDLKLDVSDASDPVDGKTAIKWTYSAKATQGSNWTGAYWQNPANNWGDKQGGYDLSAYKRLTFWAKGNKGGEKIAEFKMGGIIGEYGDTDSASTGPIEITKDWKKYTIDLSDKNLSKVVGGFCWAASRDDNPDGFELYLDEIRYEK